MRGFVPLTGGRLRVVPILKSPTDKGLKKYRHYEKRLFFAFCLRLLFEGAKNLPSYQSLICSYSLLAD